jgi:small GTP-binding protein
LVHQNLFDRNYFTQRIWREAKANHLIRLPETFTEIRDGINHFGDRHIGTPAFCYAQHGEKSHRTNRTEIECSESRFKIENTLVLEICHASVYIQFSAIVPLSAMNRSRDTIFRVVTIGDSSVGKTSILSQLVHAEFDPNATATVAAEFVHHTKQVEGQDYEMQIWDTAGAEMFRSLGPIYYRNAVGAIVVFDLSNPRSFENLSSWISAFLSWSEKNPVIIVLGNKLDLTEVLKVSELSASEWAESNGYSYFSTSAKTGIGIHEALFHMAKQFHAQKRKLANQTEMQPELVDLKDDLTESPSCGC